MLIEISPPSTTKLFTTEIKRDQDAGGGQQGHDAFLRNADETTASSAPLAWGASGTTYNWSLAYDGNNASLIIAGQTMNRDIDPDGVWNAIKLITRSGDSTRLDSATVTVVVQQANGTALDSSQTYSAELSESNEVTLGLSTQEDFTSLAGTLTWDFVFKSGALNPNSRYAFSIKGLNAVPEPGALIVLGLGTPALLARRRPR